MSTSRPRLYGLLGLLPVLLTLSGGLAVRPTAAATMEVTSLADPGTGGCTPQQCTLREVIAAAQEGDTITFAASLFAHGPRTLLLRNGELVLDKGVAIHGPGQRRLALSSNRTSRVIRVERGVVVDLFDVTIRQGWCSSPGPGLAFGGGGLWNDGGTVFLSNITVRGNAARGGYGGGLWNNEGTMTLVHSTVSGNAASSGAGLSNTGGTVRLLNSTVRGNAARHVGGGLFNYEGTVELRNSTVHSNSAGGGGGLHTKGGTVALARSTVRGNVARSKGGGLHISHGGTVALAQSTVSGNTARLGGGLFKHGFRSGVTLNYSTISGNTADLGGGLYNEGGSQWARASIIAGNTATGGPSADCWGHLRSRGTNLVGAATGCPSDPDLADLTVAPALVFTTVLGPLQANGGPTWTHALLAGSPAIDAGKPAQCPAKDQRGVPRPQGASCDIGAFELEQP